MTNLLLYNDFVYQCDVITMGDQDTDVIDTTIPSPRTGIMGRASFDNPDIRHDLYVTNYNFLPGSLGVKNIHRGLDDLRRIAVHNHFLRNELALHNELAGVMVGAQNTFVNTTPGQHRKCTNSILDKKSKNGKKHRKYFLSNRSFSDPNLSRGLSSQFLANNDSVYYHSETDHYDNVIDSDVSTSFSRTKFASLYNSQRYEAKHVPYAVYQSSRADVTHGDDVTDSNEECDDVIPEELNIDELLSEGMSQQMSITEDSNLNNEFYQYGSVLMNERDLKAEFESGVIEDDFMHDSMQAGVRFTPGPEMRKTRNVGRLGTSQCHKRKRSAGLR